MMYKPEIEKVIDKLKQNNFNVYFAENLLQAREIFLNQIFNQAKHQSVSFADSITMRHTGVIEHLKNIDSIRFIDTFNSEDQWNDRMNKRKEALTVDLFLTGTNAITESGQLVNLDMIGNRVSALAFGPEIVALFVGINKIVKDLDSAFKRIKEIAAPLNAKRHTQFKTPCQKSGICHNCNSPQRLCNVWTITEKSFPKNRINIILINEELGY